VAIKEIRKGAEAASIQMKEYCDLDLGESTGSTEQWLDSRFKIEDKVN
jgi:hypothetical protein